MSRPTQEDIERFVSAARESQAIRDRTGWANPTQCGVIVALADDVANLRGQLCAALESEIGLQARVRALEKELNEARITLDTYQREKDIDWGECDD